MPFWEGACFGQNDGDVFGGEGKRHPSGGVGPGASSSGRGVSGCQDTKPKPRWDVHMAGDGDLDWGYAGTPLPLIAGWSGSGA